MPHNISSSFTRSVVCVCIAAAATLLGSCAGIGLLVEEYPEELYSGVETLDIGVHDGNPRFLVYGDTQAGWRVNEKFLRRENWVTKKAFFFPFYYLYNVGQGVVGTVNWTRHVPDSGGEGRRMMRDAVFADIVRDRPDFLLHLGDMCLNDGRRPRHWATWLEESKVDVPLLASVPVVPVIGNHEHANDTEYGYPNYQAVFPETPRFYVMEFRDIALFVVDSDFIVDQYQFIPDAEQEDLWHQWIVAPEGQEPAWLQRELARHTQRFKVVAMHHPPVSIGRHHKDWTRSDYGADLTAKRRKFLSLLMDHGVQLVLAGHEHIYQHSTVKLLEDGGIGDETVHVVVTSGGGAPVRALAGQQEIEHASSAYMRDRLVVDLVKHASVYHFSEVSVSGNELRVKTFRIDDGDGERELLESIVIEGLKGK